MVRLISRQRGGLAALKLTKLFGIDDVPAAKDSGKVLIIIIYCYLIIIIIIIIIIIVIIVVVVVVVIVIIIIAGPREARNPNLHSDQRIASYACAPTQRSNGARVRSSPKTFA